MDPIPEIKDKVQNAKIIPLMPIKIPELEGYFGGKGGSGVYQNIINLIPPHEIFVVPFLGHCGILRNIKPSKQTIANDIDPIVVNAWRRFLTYNPNGRLYSDYMNRRFDEIMLYNACWSSFLDYINDCDNVVVYCDPPYPHSTKNSNHNYRFTFSDRDHIDFLQRIKMFRHAKILISTYDSPMYQTELEGWYKKSFQARTQQGMATETVYCNYPPPSRLHDYQYFGKDYKEREHFKLKKERLVAKFEKMEPIEHGYYLDALKSFEP